MATNQINPMPAKDIIYILTEGSFTTEELLANLRKVEKNYTNLLLQVLANIEQEQMPDIQDYVTGMVAFQDFQYKLDKMEVIIRQKFQSGV